MENMFIKRAGRRCYICGTGKTHISQQGYQVWHRAEEGKRGYRCHRCFFCVEGKRYYQAKKMRLAKSAAQEKEGKGDYDKKEQDDQKEQLLTKKQKTVKKRAGQNIWERKHYISDIMCKEPICVAQRSMVLEEYPFVRYADKFLYLKRCRDCRTFWGKEHIYCPCCGTRGGRLKSRVPQSVINKNNKENIVRRRERWLTGEGLTHVRN